MVGLLHHRPENPLDFIDVCLERVREIGWKNVRWNTFVDETEGSVKVIVKRIILYSMGQKCNPLRFCGNFSQTAEKFLIEILHAR